MEDFHPVLKAFFNSTRFLYIVAKDETHAILRITDAQKYILKRIADRKKIRVRIPIYVHNSVNGLLRLSDQIDEWSTNLEPINTSLTTVSASLSAFYKGDPLRGPPVKPVVEVPAEGEEENNPVPKKQEKPAEIYREYLVILDGERHFAANNADPSAVRKVKNLYNAVVRNPTNKKNLIVVGKTVPTFPESIADIFQVITIDEMTSEDLSEVVRNLSTSIKVDPPDLSVFKGMTLFEVQNCFTRQMTVTKPGNPFCLSVVQDQRRETLRRLGGLVEEIPTTGISFETHVGGLDRFQAWAKMIAPAWTKEGKAFGLKPPRGVLCLGVWGCGKSMSVKALANEWGVPLLQLEMGKLRSGVVGSSEGNIYRALQALDGYGDAILWIDEAEKSLSGSASSHHTDGGVGLRMLGILSTWMAESKNSITFALTVNDLSTLPIEFVNRLDVRFFFDIPEDHEREEILAVMLRRFGMDPADYPIESLSTVATRLVPREMEQALAESLFLAFQKKEPRPSPETLETVLRSKTRILDTMERTVTALREWVSYDRDRDEGRLARLASSRKRMNPPKGFRVE